MSEILFSTVILLLLGTACFGCFVWGTVRHFIWEGEGSRGAWVISLVSWIAFLAFIAELCRAPPVRWWPAACLMFVFAGAVWAWTITCTRRHPPTLAFTEDRPKMLFHEGPYRWIRHPFYTSYMTFWLGTFVADGSLVSFGTAAMLGAFYISAARHEEKKFARSELAKPYRNYATQTGMFLPKLSLVAGRQ